MEIKNIKDPSFLKDLNNAKLKILSRDIRNFLVDNVSKTGGHLSSNLGAVELTVALHKVFDAPEDKIFFDVGHQSYVHKILTGRASQFGTLRQKDGLSGYQKRDESEYDSFEAGHSSTTISAAVGMAISRDLNKEDYRIVPVIGDGALTGGIAYEALNHLGHLQKRVIVILNDNDMSISKNVGGINNFLDQLRISMPYNKAKQNYKDIMDKNTIGKLAYSGSKKIKDLVKNTVISNIFMDMGLDYIGPLDGHDFNDLIRGLKKAKDSKKPIVVHVLTKKGKGYEFAENDDMGKWHGVNKFNKNTGVICNTTPEKCKSWSSIIADAVYNEMKENKDIVTITPAMIAGSKLEKIFKDFPKRSFDVGIAEQHATMLAAGLALANKHPFLSIYSTFSQRSYDQFNHDIARMNLPIVVGIDRAGFVGEDGDTHQGLFDISLYRALPNVIISAPKDSSEAHSLVKLGFQTKAPFFIRYPRGSTNEEFEYEELEIGKWKELINNGSKKVVISYGIHSNEIESRLDNIDCDLIHALWLKPLDYSLLDALFKAKKEIIIYEPDIKAGGFGSSILEYACEKKYNTSKITCLAVKDHFVDAGTVEEQLNDNDLGYDYIVDKYLK